MIAQTIIGVDIAKRWIDACHLATLRHERIAVTEQSLAAFAQEAQGALVVLEASGGYERPVMQALERAGVSCACVNPRQARDFARATGRLARTDRIDAAMLAQMGRALELSPTPPADPLRAELADLVGRRSDLVALIQAEKNRAEVSRDPWVKAEILSLVSHLQEHLATVTARIGAHVARHGPLAATEARLRTVPGIGPVTAAVLLAKLPERGQRDARRIAALAGLAPQACDSGLRRGKRHIWGGRAALRSTLYLAGLTASRHDPVLAAFRKRLQDAGKPTKVAIIARVRKLLTILNAIVRDGTEYPKQAA